MLRVRCPGRSIRRQVVGVVLAAVLAAACTTPTYRPIERSPGASHAVREPPPPANRWPRPWREPHRFLWSINRIDDALAARMTASWRPGCPVPLRDLRYLVVGYVDFDGRDRTGELVVHKTVAGNVISIFKELSRRRFPIRRMRLVDEYGGSDDRSVLANNTSAFNCRAVTGGTSWSQHAYGTAIDINPRQNPYVDRYGRVMDPRAAPYVVRTPVRPGMIVEGDIVVSQFDAIGWGWGGGYRSIKDYQHFSRSGG